MGRTIPTTRPKIEGPDSSRRIARDAGAELAAAASGCQRASRSTGTRVRGRLGRLQQPACGGHARWHLPQRIFALAFWYHPSVRRRSCAWVAFQGHFHFGPSTHDARGHPRFAFDRTFLSPCECGVREDRRSLGKLNDAAPDDRPAWLRHTRRSRCLVRLRTLLATVPSIQQPSQHATHRRSGSRCLEWCARMRCLPLRTVSKYAGAARIPRRSRVYLSCGSAMPR